MDWEAGAAAASEPAHAPMVWYVPPLSRFGLQPTRVNWSSNGILPDVEQSAYPVHFGNLLTLATPSRYYWRAETDAGDASLAMRESRRR